MKVKVFQLKRVFFFLFIILEIIEKLKKKKM